jgi:hypothetical protein
MGTSLNADGCFTSHIVLDGLERLSTFSLQHGAV